MIKSRMSKLSKQFLRDKVSKIASYMEIFLSVLILIGILFASFTVVQQLKDLTFQLSNGGSIEFQSFLTHAIEIIIGIEFVKMLAKHTPGSAIDVLLFAIARKLIISESNMLDFLIGVVAIAILFGVKKYLTSLDNNNSEDEIILNGGTTIEDANQLANLNLSKDMGNTLAGILANIARAENVIIRPGYELQIDNYLIEVYSMDSNLIKQVRIKRAI